MDYNFNINNINTLILLHFRIILTCFILKSTLVIPLVTWKIDSVKSPKA